MKKFVKYCSSLLSFIFCVLVYGQQDEGVKAKIETKDVEGVLVIKAMVNNDSKIYQALSYQLLAVKEGKTGNLSSSQQSGKFTLQPKETKQLSELNLNVDKNDALKIFLFVRDEKNNTVSKDSLNYNLTKKIAAAEKKNFQKKIFSSTD